MKKIVFSKKIFKYVIILLAISLVSFGIYHIYGVKKAKEDAKLKKMYERQNFAFCMDMDPYYKEFSEEYIEMLIENLAAYEEDTQTTDVVTVENIKEYLSSEYNKDKKLAVLNKPSNIGAYIDWFWSGGDRYAEEYSLWLGHYMMDHPDEYDNNLAISLSEEELYELIDKFKNCPDKEKYKYF